MIHVTPDWTGCYTPRQAELEIQGFKWRGPGLYKTASYTLLVVPTVEVPEPWLLDQAALFYMFYCWEVPFADTVLGHTEVPTR